MAFPADLLLLGASAKNLSTQASQLAGVAQVIVNAQACYDHGIAENISQLVLNMAKDYAYILAPATSFGKDFLPRVAALLCVAQASDVTSIVNENTITRLMYAGSAIATLELEDAIKLMTIRPSSFDPIIESRESPAPIVEIDTVFEDSRVRFIEETISVSERPSLENASVIISGGRALQSSEQFHQLLEPLAAKLNAAIGASRAAVDAGYAPNDYQVGQTGKVVAPQLYIAIGISGAVQHLAGMKDSKVIVVINKDADAPIFQIADYGLVGDLFQIIPELTAKLNAQ